jgi:hypothetical protein
MTRQEFSNVLANQTKTGRSVHVIQILQTSATVCSSSPAHGLPSTNRCQYSARPLCLNASWTSLCRVLIISRTITIAPIYPGMRSSLRPSGEEAQQGATLEAIGAVGPISNREPSISMNFTDINWSVYVKRSQTAMLNFQCMSFVLLIFVRR